MSSADPAYFHRDKYCWSREGPRLGGASLKWYDIARQVDGIPDNIAALARTFLARTSPELGGDLGFVILHRCGVEFYFLLAQTWRNENELWESVYAKQSAADADFALFPQSSPHRGTFCVWELGAVAHERLAWRRYLLSARDEAAKRAYLADAYEGAV